jgi:ABC-2 type transport system ATP-binding protein
MPAAIEVDGLSKRYRLGQNLGQYVTLREGLSPARWRRRPPDADYLWALRGVSFEVAEGEALGVIGANGAGKTTLLKVLARITEPTSGVSRTRGRAGALLDVGTGFHPELTGDENIYLNAAILGMSEAETNRKYDEITAFADIDEFLDSPVAYYSSGMHARLGFAIAIHVDADIFLADEALAVGDKPFKVKCMKKLKEIRDSGVTIFYVSHAAGSVRNICSRVLVLEKGVLGFDGDVEAGIKYVRYDDDSDGTDDELGSEV